MKSGVIALICAFLLGCDSGSQLLTRETVQSFEPAGQWLVVNYWAVWCKPCVHEIPELNALAEAEPELMVLGINYDGVGQAELIEQRDKLAIRFPLLVSDPRKFGVEKPSVLPTTFLVNPAGEVAMTLIGPQSKASILFALNTVGYQ